MQSCLKKLTESRLAGKWLELRFEPSFTWLLSAATFPVYDLTESWAQLRWAEPPSDQISLLFLAGSQPSIPSDIWSEALEQISYSDSWKEL